MDVVGQEGACLEVFLRTGNDAIVCGVDADDVEGAGRRYPEAPALADGIPVYAAVPADYLAARVNDIARSRPAPVSRSINSA